MLTFWNITSKHNFCPHSHVILNNQHTLKKASQHCIQLRRHIPRLSIDRISVTQSVTIHLRQRNFNLHFGFGRGETLGRPRDEWQVGH